MKLSIPIAVLVAMTLLLILAPCGRVQSQTTYIQYKVVLSSDGSAFWIITQVSGVNGVVDSWNGFQQKANTLVSSAENQTHRTMYVDNSSFQISTYVTSNESKTTQYTFTWFNFSRVDKGQLIVGDIFGAPDFFNNLYGDGALQIKYPVNYTLQSVTPTPDENDNSTQTLQWLGTQFFVDANPNLTLSAQNYSPTTGQPPYLVLGSVAVVAIVAGFAGWFFLFNKRKKQAVTAAAAAPVTLLETEEEKVVRALRSSGGSAYQSAIKEQCRFSKAKTSQLLSSLETKGVVRRVKKGRDKIVNLIEPTKGEK